MKYLFGIKRNLLFVFLFGIGGCNYIVAQKRIEKDTAFSLMMEKCAQFVNNYKPTHIDKGDTLDISTFTTPPDDINKFLFDCIKRKDYRPLKYSVVIFLFQGWDAYLNLKGGDVPVVYDEFPDNGFVQLMKSFLCKFDSVFISGPGMPLAYTNHFLDLHKDSISDYKFVKMALSNLISYTDTLSLGMCQERTMTFKQVKINSTPVYDSIGLKIRIHNDMNSYKLTIDSKCISGNFFIKMKEILPGEKKEKLRIILVQIPYTESK
ncbi:MAG: hypothetical protein ACLQQ4_15060 [Bacteroidia bacterium]